MRGITNETATRAQLAVKNFRRMQPGLTAYAQAVTGRRDVTVEPHGGASHTDGRTIFFRPPMTLADEVKHDRELCDKRNPVTDLLLCEACAVRESVLSSVYHEIAHIVFESFAKVTDADRKAALLKGADLKGNRFAETMERKLEIMGRDPELSSYMHLANTMSEFLPTILNMIEDIRIDEKMFQARKGIRRMREAQLKEVLSKGIERDDGTIWAWRDAPLNSQLIISFYSLASKFQLEGNFHEDVIEALKNERIIELCNSAKLALSASDTFDIAFELLVTGKELGFFAEASDPDPLPDAPPESEQDSDNQDESEQSSDKNGDTDDDKQSGKPDVDDEEEPAEDDAGAGDQQDAEGDGEAEGGGDDSSGEGEDGPESSGEVPDGGADGVGEDDSNGEASEDTGEEDGAGSDTPDASDASDTPDASDTSGADSAPEDSDPDDLPEQEEKEEVGVDEPTEEEAAEDKESGEQDEHSDPTSMGGSAGSGDSTETSGSGGDDPQDTDHSDSGDRDADSDSSDGTGESESGSGDPSQGEGDASNGNSSQGEEASASDETPDMEGESGDTAESQAEPTGADTADDLEDAEPVAPIDSGADAGEGGIESDKPSMGGAGEIPEYIEALLGHHADHSTDSPSDENTEEENKALGAVIVQGEYFEKPAQNVSGVNIHHWNQLATVKEDAWRGTNGGYTEQPGGYDIRTLNRVGIKVDTDVPESVLGAALLETRRTFDDNRRARHERNLKSGKINGRSLGKRAPFNDQRLFKKTTMPGKKSYSVLIGIDISGSTVGENIALAKRAAKAQAELCARVGIDFAIYAHTANHNEDYGLSLELYQIKDFRGQWDTNAKDALDNIGAYADNLDGHTIQVYRKMIEREQTTDKIILYYTDGKMPAANAREELRVLQDEIRTCKQKGIALMGVGIRTDSPTRHGLDTVQVDTDQDLVKVVRHLEKKLIVR